MMEDEVMEFLLLTGAIEAAGVDSRGEILYSFTPKIKEIMPELYEEHMRTVNREIMHLWEKGFVNFNPMEDNPTVTLAAKALDEEELEKLSKEDQWAIEELKRMMRKNQ